MKWHRSNALGLAKASCAYCLGYGTRTRDDGQELPCRCVFRAAFRACYNRFRECVANAEHTSTVSLEFSSGLQTRRSYSRKSEEYIADFCLVAKRALNEFDHRVFRYHFLLGADWRLCCRRMSIDKGTFFHAVYEIEQQLGRAYAELEPYALYPPAEYFGTVLYRPMRVYTKPVVSRPPRREPHISLLEAVRLSA